MTLDIAVIKKTPTFIDVNRGIEQIKGDIDEIVDDVDCVKIETINDQNELINFLVTNIEPSGNMISGSKNYINDTLYQCMFEGLSNVEDHSSKSLNMLGSQFSDGVPTERPVVITKNKIISDSNIELTSISRYDLKALLEDKFIKQGVIYKQNGTKETYNYSQNHLDNLMYKLGKDYVLNNYQYDEMELGNMVFIIASDKTETDKNELMSSIVKKPVCGDVFCSLYMKQDHLQEAMYISIDLKQFDKITFLLSNPNFDPTDENYGKLDSSQHHDQLNISPHTTIDRMYNSIKH
jgi:hypothetical protein